MKACWLAYLAGLKTVKRDTKGDLRNGVGAKRRDNVSLAPSSMTWHSRHQTEPSENVGFTIGRELAHLAHA